MALLHDVATRSALERRIKALTPDSRRQWGTMTPDQMLWHVKKAMDLSLGRITVKPGSPPIPKWLLKFIVLRVPMMKNGPTHPDFVAKATHDFNAERAKLLQLITDVAATPLDGEWKEHPAFGRMTGTEVSALSAKHLDHHLRQFGV